MKFPSHSSNRYGTCFALVLFVSGLAYTSQTGATDWYMSIMNQPEDLVWLATVLNLTASVISIVRFILEVCVPQLRRKR